MHSVAAYDAVAAGHTGLSWPDMDHAGAMSLLQTLRTGVGRPPVTASGVHPLLPVAGDVRGFPAGTQFERDALSAGEAVIISDPDDSTKAVGLVPEVDDDESGEPSKLLLWTVYSLPDAPVPQHLDLGEAEYGLRSAVRSAAEALTAVGIGLAGADVEDPRGLVEQLLESMCHHRIPDHAPPRAVRVLQNAAHVDAIVTVSAGLSRIGTPSSLQAQIATDALRPLAFLVRSARMAAVDAILHSAWH